MFIVSYDLYEVGVVFSVQRFQYFKGKHTFKHNEITNKRKQIKADCTIPLPTVSHFFPQ